MISSRSGQSLIVDHPADNVDDLLGGRTDLLEAIEDRFGFVTVARGILSNSGAANVVSSAT